jgi:putative ABC transport system permease protein
VSLLTRDFVFLVIAGLAIASPIAWLTMHKWLQNYVYHIYFGIGIFLIAGSGLLFITLVTTGFQSIKAALANPVKSLRTE